jgi:hypothetical protein
VAAHTAAPLSPSAPSRLGEAKVPYVPPPNTSVQGRGWQAQVDAEVSVVSQGDLDFVQLHMPGYSSVRCWVHQKPVPLASAIHRTVQALKGTTQGWGLSLRRIGVEKRSNGHLLLEVLVFTEDPENANNAVDLRLAYDPDRPVACAFDHFGRLHPSSLKLMQTLSWRSPSMPFDDTEVGIMAPAGKLLPDPKLTLARLRAGASWQGVRKASPGEPATEFFSVSMLMEPTEWVDSLTSSQRTERVAADGSIEWVRWLHTTGNRSDSYELSRLGGNRYQVKAHTASGEHVKTFASEGGGLPGQPLREKQLGAFAHSQATQLTQQEYSPALAPFRSTPVVYGRRSEPSPGWLLHVPQDAVARQGWVNIQTGALSMEAKIAQDGRVLVQKLPQKLLLAVIHRKRPGQPVQSIDWWSQP